MYAVGGDHPLKEPCLSLLRRVAMDDPQAVTDSEAHQEIYSRYMSLRQHPFAEQTSRYFLQVGPNVLPVTRIEIQRLPALLQAYPHLQARDLIHLAVMLSHGIREIATSDRGFDRVKEVKRLALEDF